MDDQRDADDLVPGHVFGERPCAGRVDGEFPAAVEREPGIAAQLRTRIAASFGIELVGGQLGECGSHRTSGSVAKDVLCKLSAADQRC